MHAVLSPGQEMIIFMAVEAGAVIPLCCGLLYVLLNLVNRARLQLFNVFLVSGCLRSWVTPLVAKLPCFWMLIY